MMCPQLLEVMAVFESWKLKQNFQVFYIAFHAYGIVFQDRGGNMSAVQLNIKKKSSVSFGRILMLLL